MMSKGKSIAIFKDIHNEEAEMDEKIKIPGQKSGENITKEQLIMHLATL